MITGHDLATFDFWRIDVPQKHRCTVIPLHSELLIKIAIVNFSTPADADRIAAHQTVNSCGVKGVNQQLHVLIEFIAMPQITREPADWKIRQCIELVKDDSEMFFELPLVIALQLDLRRR